MSHEFIPSSSSEAYTIGTKSYPISGHDCVAGVSIPRLDIPMMSDSKWQAMAVQSAVDDYTQAFGAPPPSLEEALQWNRRRCRGE